MPTILLATSAAALMGPAPAEATRAGQTPKLEVAFVLDATGSMGPYIRQARDQIKAISTELASGQPAPEVRFALVTYRDRDDDYIANVNPFTANVEVMKTHLDETKASGGGDRPEAALEGLDEAISKLKWSTDDDQVIKMIYLIGDAPAKHYFNGPTEKSVAAAARKKNIVIHSIACGNMNSAGTATWSKVARWTEGRSFKLGSAAHAHRGADFGGAASAGGMERASLAAAVGGSARAYSTSVGVDYGTGRAIATNAVPGAYAIASSGLLGPHVRWIRDPLAWRDAWAAHTSTLTDNARPALPAIDFTTHAVIVAGGDGGALSIDEVRMNGGIRAASVSPIEGSRVQFAVIALDGGGAK